MQVTVEIPDAVASQLGANPERVGRRMMEDAAIESYRTGRLSHRQLAEMLGLDYWMAEAFLQQRGVPLNYTADDLAADAAVLNDLPRKE